MILLPETIGERVYRRCFWCDAVKFAQSSQLLQTGSGVNRQLFHPPVFGSTQPTIRPLLQILDPHFVLIVDMQQRISIARAGYQTAHLQTEYAILSKRVVCASQ